jgi:predicted pyridoxine 5'-phosphate oxidase superfamily flavin-nucleotide-binding protein
VEHAGEREAQLRWGTDETARREKSARVLFDHVPAQLLPRVAAAPYFFLATAGPDGSCDCSFKGGGPGLVRFPDTRTCLFPDYDGNDLFMSLGNILANPHVGMLFIDFADGGRLRINGDAQVHDHGPLMALFPGAPRVVEVSIRQVVLNCARHVPRLVPADAATGSVA